MRTNFVAVAFIAFLASSSSLGCAAAPAVAPQQTAESAPAGAEPRSGSRADGAPVGAEPTSSARAESAPTSSGAPTPSSSATNGTNTNSAEGALMMGILAGENGGPPGLAPEVIQPIVRAHYRDVLECYEVGRGRNRALEGRVVARFVIGLDGKVSDVVDAGSDLPDADVVACALRVFSGLSFPQPKGGRVTVTYPLLLEPEKR